MTNLFHVTVLAITLAAGNASAQSLSWMYHQYTQGTVRCNTDTNDFYARTAEFVQCALQVGQSNAVTQSVSFQPQAPIVVAGQPVLQIALVPVVQTPFNSAVVVTPVPAAVNAPVGVNNNPGAIFDFSQLTSPPVTRVVSTPVFVAGPPSVIPQPPLAVPVQVVSNSFDITKICPCWSGRTGASGGRAGTGIYDSYFYCLGQAKCSQGSQAVNWLASQLQIPYANAEALATTLASCVDPVSGLVPPPFACDAVTPAPVRLAQVSDCPVAQPRCNHSLDVSLATILGGASVLSETDTMTFKPTLPGKYSFVFESKDLCGGQNRTESVFVRCPPAPDANLGAFPAIVKQGSTVTFSSGLSAANSRWAGAPDYLTYTWTFTAKPAEEKRAAFLPSTTYCSDSLTVANGKCPAQSVAGPAKFTTPVVSLPGKYQIQLEVFDGCSSNFIRGCFEVQCNCGPTANAQSTSTIWSNVAGTGDNSADQGFLLDGSSSYDFDMLPSGNGEKLTYDFDLVSWEPADLLEYATLRDGKTPWEPLPFGALGTQAAGLPVPNAEQKIWYKDNSRNQIASQQLFGYQVVAQANPPPFAKIYDFVRKAKISNAAWTNTTTQGSNVRSSVTNSSVAVAAYPRWVHTFGNDGTAIPGAQQNYQDYGYTRDALPAGASAYDPVTTSCTAYVTKTQLTVTTEQTHTDVATKIVSLAADDYVYCRIKIQQSSSGTGAAGDSAVSKAMLYMVDPVANSRPFPLQAGSPTFELCRGLFTLRLTVQDGCGQTTQSTDDFMVTVRCNRPPVAVLCCNTTVVYNTQVLSFEQVTVDGRSSQDRDNNLLTYFWSFVSYPAAHKTACEAQRGQPCQQNYCQNVITGTYRTRIVVGESTEAPSKAFGNATRLNSNALAGISSYREICSPQPYQIIYDYVDSKKFPAGCTNPGTPLPATAGATYCNWPAVENTQQHVGNSAFFKPTTPGDYQVRLAVFDGCSTTSDTVTIRAVCPAISGTIDASPLNGQYYPAGSGRQTSKITLSSFIQYEGTAASLQYRWKVQGPAGATVVVDSPTAVNTSFTPTSSGAYVVTLEMSDGCTTAQKINPSLTVTMGCNTRPVALGVQSVGTMYPAGGRTINPSTAIQQPLVLDPASQTYPQVTIVATGTDFENDTLTTDWAIYNADNASIPFDGTRQYPNGTSNNTLVFAPNFKAGGTSSQQRYIVEYRMNDGCQQSAEQTVPVTFSCDTSLGIALDPRDNPILVNYNFATGFPAAKVDASGSTLPYKTTTRYTWRLRDNSDLTKDLAEGGAATTSNSPSLSWTPNQQVTTKYLVELVVSDGCSSRTAATTVQTQCTSVPNAALAISPSTPDIEWNSFSSAKAGAFPLVTLDGSLSQNAAGASALTYGFVVLSPATAKAPTPVLNGATPTGRATVQPTDAGRYDFRLVVSNGPCASQPSSIVGFNAICHTIQVRLSTTTGNVITPPSNAQYSSAWNGVSFDIVYLDGTKTTYQSRNGTAANYNSLRSTWRVDASPATSMFEASADTTVLTPASGGFDKVTVVQQTPVINSTHEVYTTTYVLRKLATTTSTVTTLFNHHYNLPYTAFRPDVQGNYQITLTVSDGCSSASVQSVITATCGSLTVPDLVVIDKAGVPTSSFALSGTSYQRVTIDARATAPASARDTLTYSWSIAGPASSKAKLTNPQGNVASVMPDVPGTYTVTLLVDDKCSTPRPKTATFTVTCTSGAMQFQATQILIVSGTSEVATAIPEIRFQDAKVAQGSLNYKDQAFKLVGKSGSNCAVLSRRWYADKRECATAYDVSAAPPVSTVTSSCAAIKQCTWRVTKFPCGWNANPPLSDRVPFVPPAGPSGDLSEGGEICSTEKGTCVAGCSAKFTCKSPGTYELQLSVNDGCSVTTETTTVTCKCQNVLQADAGAAQTSFYQCTDKTTNKYDFQAITLVGKYNVASVRGDGYLSQACPAAAAAVLPALPVTSGSCCPAATPCPACPMCSSCPVCSTTTAGSAPAAGGAAFATRRKVPKALTSREEKTSDESLNLLLGTAVPVAILTVISLAANVFLFKIYKSEEDE